MQTLGKRYFPSRVRDGETEAQGHLRATQWSCLVFFLVQNLRFQDHFHGGGGRGLGFCRAGSQWERSARPGACKRGTRHPLGLACAPGVAGVLGA